MLQLASRPGRRREMVGDDTERPWREEQREVAQIGEVNLVVMDCEHARNDEVV